MKLLRYTVLIITLPIWVLLASICFVLCLLMNLVMLIKWGFTGNWEAIL